MSGLATLGGAALLGGFWTLVAVVAYVYFGYPLLLALVALRKREPEPERNRGALPTVTMVISAYNEADVIADKIRNTLALDYPADKLETIVVSDASSDATDAIVASFAGSGIRLLRMPERGGKTVGLNAAVAVARGEIIVFSDANAMYGADAVKMLAGCFADERIGAVVGESRYAAPEAASERSEGLYWRYETAIKKLESRTGSVVGGDGAIYAVRKKLYEPMDQGALSDFVNPLQVVRRGFRCIYEPRAWSLEGAADSFAAEYRRKVRIVNRAWRAAMGMRDMLNPWSTGFFAVKLISHKLLRWLMPAFLLALFILNLALLREGWLYLLALGAQVTFYALALVGYALRARTDLPTIVSFPFYFTMVNVAAAQGIIDAYRGKTYATWATARASG